MLLFQLEGQTEQGVLIFLPSHALDKLKKSYPAEPERLPQHRAMQLLRTRAAPQQHHRAQRELLATGTKPSGRIRCIQLCIVQKWQNIN